ncbi:glycoprotein hormones alpha chain [Gymnodraco acuticeps]|uniref:Glycoprotein hormones alpha chain n=1 Tax=Gymnodraco acuticeps TaxID=8218 RepID=A0A6P8VP98_GYMAC|nr:glycoprotein hormones alpha chain [Gymnodraco acuticeps]
MKRELSHNMMTCATTMQSVKSAGLSLLLMSFLLYVADSYPSMDSPNMACPECALKRNNYFPGDRPIYQCVGCCFSRAYPTPLWSLKTMRIPKNITSESTCCVASRSYESDMVNIKLFNHTECHCSTCHHNKI